MALARYNLAIIIGFDGGETRVLSHSWRLEHVRRIGPL
jgi:hypothetical protein